MFAVRNTSLLVLASCLGAVFALSGCGSQSAENLLANANDSNIEKLANLYGKFQQDHSWKGPANEQEFRDYIDNAVPDFIKERIGFTTTDEVFVSQRDSEPFQIRYEIVGSARGCSEPAIFEATGRGGKRMVGFLNMEQREVDDQEYQALWEGKSDAP